jgi:hypothetical protein
MLSNLGRNTSSAPTSSPQPTPGWTPARSVPVPVLQIRTDFGSSATPE